MTLFYRSMSGADRPHSLLEISGFVACGLRPLLTGDRRHGRGCELRRCSGRLTGGPGAPNGASRHRSNDENGAAQLLFGRGARAGSHRSSRRPLLRGICPSSRSLGLGLENGRRDHLRHCASHYSCSLSERPCQRRRRSRTGRRRLAVFRSRSTDDILAQLRLQVRSLSFVFFPPHPPTHHLTLRVPVPSLVVTVSRRSYQK